MLTFDISGAQISGARDYQEDAFLITHLGDSNAESGSLIIVADGMGGHAAGNVASNMAVQTFNKHVTANFPSDGLAPILRTAVEEANQSITETVRETAALKGMGCTLVASVLAGKELRWVSVGDSHLYVVRDGKFSKSNADHSYGGFLDRMATEGTPVEPEAGFSRNMLMSALTGDDIADIDCPDEPLELQAGDRIIVASDGLDTLSHGQIAEYCSAAESARDCVDALLRAVEAAEMPRQDNTTVVAVFVGEKVENKTPEFAATPPPPPPPVFAAVEEDDTDDKRRGGGIMMIALVAVVAAAAAGGWFVMNQPQTAGPEIVETESDDDDVTAISESPEVDPTVEPEPRVVEPEAPPAPVVAVDAGRTFSDSLASGGTGPEMVWIPAGSFTMGSRISSAEQDEHPPHTVRVGSFAMSTREVTIAEYARFARARGRTLPKTGDLNADTHPVFFVTWNDALDYAKWLSNQTGKSYRVPTEAEWEYAARAGTVTAYWWGRNLGSDNAHCFACETGLNDRQPTRVGRFKANAFGVYDTAGNVQEWVFDCYHKNYEGAPTDGSDFKGGDCALRVVRGGAYTSGPKALRSAARDTFRFDGSNDSIGIRVVRDP